MTCSMWGTSKPLAAISVATSILYFCSRKFFMTLSRLLCLKFPFSDSDLKPSFDKFFAILSVPCFVLTKINIEPSRSFICSNNSAYLASCLIFKMS